MARHLDLTADTGARIYFCDAASPWQRGGNENANGLLEYFPNSTDFSVHTPLRDLARVESKLNRRPRVVLGDPTPQRLLSGLASLTAIALVATTA